MPSGLLDGLTEIVPGAVWTYTEPFRFLGAPIGARMTLVRLRDGGLWVHSPLDVSAETRGQIAALGPVRCIVAPSIGHFRGVNAFRRHYPEARLYASPGLARPRFPITLLGIHADAALGDTPPPEWAAEIDQRLLHGHRFLDEVVFLHRAGRTLILTDLVFSLHADGPPLARAIWRKLGCYRRPAVPPEIRATFRDRAAARATLEAILAWEFDRILYCHGRPLTSGAKEALREAYRFLIG